MIYNDTFYLNHEHSFELLSPKELDFLEENKTTIVYKKNEKVLRQNSFIDDLLYIKRGLVKVYMEGNQKDIILTLKKENSYLGLSSIHCQSDFFLYSSVAMIETEIDHYHMESFKKILSQNALFANEIIKYINHNSAMIYSRFSINLEKHARGKVADMILHFSDSVFSKEKFTIPMTRTELAAYAGLSMENTVRILREFENDKIIDLQLKEFKIIDKKALYHISEFG